jgi:hypothetical protein
MYSYLGQDGKLALRLPAPDRDRFLQTYGASLRMAHGRIQAEYVEVPDALFSATAELMPYFDQAYAYVSSLKPKPTTRKAG